MYKGTSPALLETDLPLPMFRKGKTRDIYDLGRQLLVIATDRVSAFDVVLRDGIPWKGFVLNQMSLFWFRHTSSLITNHVLEPVDDVKALDYYLVPETRFDYPPYLAGRSMVVKKADRIAVECVVRGYLTGSAWEEYQKSGTVAGNPLPAGLAESQELEHPLFTPTTKADTGHDLPISMDKIVDIVGEEVAREMSLRSLAIYRYAREIARSKGILIADTKMEFGMEDGKLILIDELLTPDSSRFWDASLYRAGQPQPSLDKQPLRDWLTKSGWNKEPPAPSLPAQVIEDTSHRYIQAYEKLTGRRIK